MILRRVFGHFAACAVCASCGDAPPASSTTASQWVVSSEPILSIGGDDEREDYLLFGVTGAVRQSDGTIVVANQGSSELKFFDGDGVHVRTVGGEGDGPGEMRSVMQLLRQPGDSLLVLSFRPGLTWFAPDGEFVRSRSIDLWSVGGVECRLGEGNWYVLPDASLLTILEDNFYGTDCPTQPPNPWRQSGLIGRQVPDGTFDTLAIMPATGRNSPNYRAYGKSLLLGMASDRVYAGDTGSDVILSLSLTGDTLAVLPTPFDAMAIPGSAKTQSVREFERPDGSLQIGNAYLYPEEYPRFGRLLVSRSGDLWVMAYPPLEEPINSWRLAIAFAFLVEDGGAQWRVLDPVGSLRAEVRTPPGVFPLEVGENYVLGLSKNELDVETIGLYPLSR